MDPLDFMASEELLQFLHRNKTSMSCMENPHTFLSQLRDHDMIPEDRYQTVSHMKSREKIRKALYNILDQFEKQQSQHIHDFWRCVFQEAIMDQYPTLKQLQNSLMDGSFHFDTQLPKTVEKQQKNEKKRKQLSEDEDGEKNSENKKRKQKSGSLCNDDEEQPGPSTELSPAFALKKREKNNVLDSVISNCQLPVTCGDLEGTLHKEKLAKGEECILFQNEWFTPGEFEKLAGKERSKNWKSSIRCYGTTLGKFIQEGHLKAAKFKGGCKKTKTSLLTCDQTVRDEEEETEEQTEQQQGEDNDITVFKVTCADITFIPDEEDDTEELTEQQQEPSNEGSKMVFKVSCGVLTGTLHEKRFASGTCGKSIRTETSWMSPVEFVMEGLNQTDVSWKRDIKWDGKPLCALIEGNVLKIHSPLCDCNKCQPDQEDLKDQKNDDECWVCKSDEGQKLVVCDQCPRSFHQKCHLPRVTDAIAGDNKRWMCTFCIFRKYQEWRYSDELEMQAALSKQISKHMLECQYLLLSLYSADEEQTLASNPNINTLMWFGTVEEKLQTNKYRTVGEFVSDVQLIFTNCATDNRDDAEFLAWGRRLKKLFLLEFKKAFNVCEQTVD